MSRKSSELYTPCLLVDLDKVERNCTAMRQRCERLGVQLRPHMKTHKTLEGGLLMTGGSRSCITVSTLAEAEFFCDGGFDDILYAYPLTQDKVTRAEVLNNKISKFHVLIDCATQLASLQSTKSAKPWSVFLDVDVGYNRTGANPSDVGSVDLARRIADHPSTRLAGVYTHCGQSYNSRGATEIQQTASEVADCITQFAKKLRSEGIECPVVGMGSTPSCSQPPGSLPGVTEFHPGNYVFYDLQQVQAGSCQRSDIAVRVMTRVIGHYPERGQLAVDSGFTAVSKQHGDETIGFGLFEDHPELKLVGMSQELGKVESSEGSKLDVSRYPIGTILYLLPYHSCAVAVLHPVYYVCRGENVVAEWKPCRGW